MSSPLAGSSLTLNDLGQLVDPAQDNTLAVERHLGKAPETPSVQAVAIQSLNGYAAVDGVSGGLGQAFDHQLLLASRARADVVVVGAATVRAERYGGVKLTPAQREARVAQGQQSTPPPLAILSTRGDLDTALPAFQDTETPPIVIVTDPHPKQSQVAQLESAGAQVWHLPNANARDCVENLRAQGYAQISCEGGPTILAEFLSLDLIDTLYLSQAPILSDSHQPRLFTAPRKPGTARFPLRFHVDWVSLATDGYLFQRLRRKA